MLEEVSKLRQQLGMPRSFDDFQDFESTVTPKVTIPAPRPLSGESSAVTADSDSWTTHYRQLTRSRNTQPETTAKDKSEELSSEIFNGTDVMTIASEKSLAGTDQESENDKDSDCSRESSIKETVHSSEEATVKEAAPSRSRELSIKQASWQVVEEDSDQDYLDESFDVGSSGSEDDFSD